MLLPGSVVEGSGGVLRLSAAAGVLLCWKWCWLGWGAGLVFGGCAEAARVGR
jgi:hypothetical protein